MVAAQGTGHGGKVADPFNGVLITNLAINQEASLLKLQTGMRSSSSGELPRHHNEQKDII